MSTKNRTKSKGTNVSVPTTSLTNKMLAEAAKVYIMPFVDRNRLKEFTLDGNRVNRETKDVQIDTLVKSLSSIEAATRDVLVFKMHEGIYVKGKPGELFIIDGQHLHKALGKLGLDTPYRLLAIKSMSHLVKVMATLNSTAKAWGDGNYIDAWCACDLTEKSNVLDYVKLRNAITQNKLDEDLNNGRQIGEVIVGGVLLKNTVPGFKANALYKKTMRDGEFTLHPDGLLTLEQTKDVSEAIHKHDAKYGKMVGKSDIIASIVVGFIKCKFEITEAKNKYRHTEFLNTFKKIIPALVMMNPDEDKVRSVIKSIMLGTFGPKEIAELVN